MQNEFEILKFLGKGGFGDVLKVRYYLLKLLTNDTNIECINSIGKKQTGRPNVRFETDQTEPEK